MVDRREAFFLARAQEAAAKDVAIVAKAPNRRDAYLSARAEEAVAAALPPNNQVKIDDVISAVRQTVTVNAANAADISTEGVRTANRLLAGQQFTPSTVSNNTDFVNNELSRLGVNFAPKDNPLNRYANYTYHIRWFLTDENTAYNAIDKSNPNADNINKTIIAESGVTVGFNITDFEMENTCGPNGRTLNTASTTWSMTITEPFGLSLIDKLRATARTQPVINYMRAPYFIDIWFTGYDENGNIVEDKLFYQLFRVTILNMNVDITEGGSRYAITGIFDNDLGFSNQIAIPQGGLTIQANTVGQFFRLLGIKLTDQQKKVSKQDFADVEYQINVPPEMQNWAFRASDSANQDNRNDDMSIDSTTGTMNVTINLGMSIETIVNRVISMCPDADPWVKGETAGGTAGVNAAEITSNGFASWVMVHSDVKIIGFNAYTRDYIRKVTYSLVRYRTARTGADAATLASLESKSVQQEKLNFLKNAKALEKLYQYIYTGKNTEIIRFDIRVENLWSITLPVWEGVNTYSNYTQGLLKKENAIGDQLREGTYIRSGVISALQSRIEELNNEINSTNIGAGAITKLIDEQTTLSREALLLETQANAAVYFGDRNAAARERLARNGGQASPGELTTNSVLLKNPEVAEYIATTSSLLGSQKALRYAEDVKIVAMTDQDPMPIVIKPDNQPAGQNAAQSSDSNKSVASPNSLGLPSGRTFIGSILGNMFDPSFFNVIDLEIRGDPYWMGQSNIRQNLIAASYGQGNSDSRFANYQICDHMFVLVFRSGENYNESTGLMEFAETSDFFNGVYGVLLVKSTFRNGSFTQVLNAAKDIFAQKVSNEVSAAIVPTDETTTTTVDTSGITNSPLSISDVVSGA
jgi:hypothetical protein